MFSIFNIKKKSELGVPDCRPTSSSSINTESSIAVVNEEKEDDPEPKNTICTDVHINDALDLGNLNSGPHQPVLKVDLNLK